MSQPMRHSQSVKNMPHAFVRKFIELYKSLPCLWKVSCADYSDKRKRRAAYEKLIALCKTVNADADTNYVKTKIVTFRGSFRKEFNKVQESKKPGVGGQVYVPRLWYYKLMLFTADIDTTKKPTSNMLLCQEREKIQEAHTLTDLLPCENVYVDDFKMAETPSGSDTYEASSPLPPPVASLPLPHSFSNETELSSQAEPRRKRMRKRDDDEIDYFLSLVGERLKASRSEDQFDIMGKYIATKLRNLSREQCIFAEKFIHEILFEAELGNLSSSSTIFTPQPSY